MYPDDREILVVDSNEPRRRAIAQLLRDEGFRVTSVSEGFAALRTLRAREFALLIAATELPGALDGITTLHQARTWQGGLKALFVADCGHLPPWPGSGAEEIVAWPAQRWELIGCVFELLHRDDAASADLASRCRTELRAV